MSNWNSQSRAGNNFALASAIGGRPWNWLLELCRPLNVSVQLVDQRLAPVLPSDGAASDELRRVLAVGASPLNAGLTTAIQTRETQFVAIGSLHAVCAPLLTDGKVAGALVIARTASSQGQPIEVARARLELVGSWLTAAVEGHLQSPAAPTSNLLPLFRVLGRTVEHGSDRDLVSLFAEALAVWHDIEAVGYVETAPGVFAQEVSLAGRTEPSRPLVLPPAAVPLALQLQRMPRADIEGSIPTSTQDVMVTTLSRGRGSPSWLLMLSGSLDDCEVQSLANYVAVLDASIARLAETAKADVTVALSRRLINGEADAGDVMVGALDELRQRLRASSVLLTVETQHGAPLLKTTSPPNAVLSPLAGPGPNTLTVVRREPGEHAMVLVLSRTEGPQFTPLEHQVAQAAAVVLEIWTRRVGEAGEGDTSVPGFGQTIEYLAKEALDRGTVVTAVVMSAGSPSGGRATEKWVDAIRRRMRQSDAVGMLPAGEIGLLLHDTTAAHAKAVTSRLQSAIGTAGDADSLPIRAIGFATRMPGQGVADGIVQDARLDAMNRSNGESRTGI